MNILNINFKKTKGRKSRGGFPRYLYIYLIINNNIKKDKFLLIPFKMIFIKS